MSLSRPKVVVAMSGGVDSSVSAALLVEQGYDVSGIMMRLWAESGQASQRDNRCCTRDQMLDAHFVSRKLGIPFEVVDVRETFKKKIVDYFVQGYRDGVTPNPCLRCNREIRFTFLLELALSRGADYLATGHYARISLRSDGIFELHKGVDQHKDQSYVLSVLSQHQLRHALFPLGELTKPEVRDTAKRFGLPVASKADSQDLCFVADGNYRRFLKDNSTSEQTPGPIITKSGKLLGQHTGLMDYTVGQRKGLGISFSEPLYVLEKDLESNSLVVGTMDDLGVADFYGVSTHWISGSLPASPFEADVKIRYKATPRRARIEPQSDGMIQVHLIEPAPDVTPGQGLVIYDADTVIGSAIIQNKI